MVFISNILKLTYFLHSGEEVRMGVGRVDWVGGGDGGRGLGDDCRESGKSSRADVAVSILCPQ